jgi:mannose-1-phosphate guanylyltransferase/mannose-6-phosphate isomerase
MPPLGLLSKRRYRTRYHRAEHCIVVRGTAQVTLTTKSSHSRERIDLRAARIVSNPGKISLELIEVQVGSYLGEDDRGHLRRT